MRKTILIQILAALAFIAPNASESAEAKKIALLLKAPNNPFYDSILHGAKEKASEFGYKIEPVFGKDEDDWSSQVDYLNTQSDKYDGFILVPNRSDKFSDPIKALRNKNKPVIIVDTPLSEGSENALTTISSDNRRGGRLAGLFIVNQLSVEPARENCLVLFSGNPKAKTHQDRNSGFLEIVKERRPDIKVYSYEAYSSFERARELTEKNIKQILKCYGVFAGSDTMILGMLDYFEAHNLREPPVAIGYDSLVQIQQKILESKVMGSVQQSPGEMGRSAVASLNQYFQGKPVKTEQIIDPKLTVRKFQLDSLTEKELEIVSPAKAKKM